MIGIQNRDQPPAGKRGIHVSHNLQIEVFRRKMSAMTDIIRLLDELGPLLLARRLELGLSKKELAQRAGKVREVIYRLERGEDVTLSSLMAVLGALGLAMRLEKAGLPTLQEVAARFRLDEDDEDAA